MTCIAFSLSSIRLEFPINRTSQGMDMEILKSIILFLWAIFTTQAHLAFEYLALRRYIAVKRKSVKRLKLRSRDRFFGVVLFKIWSGLQSPMLRAILTRTIESTSQKPRSRARNIGRFADCDWTASCCRKARFSKTM